MNKLGTTAFLWETLKIDIDLFTLTFPVNKFSVFKDFNLTIK